MFDDVLATADEMLETDNTTQEDLVLNESSGNEHPLGAPWTIWYGVAPVVKKAQDGATSQPPAAGAWEDALLPVKDFDTVEGFWWSFREIKIPTQMDVGASYHCFKDAVKPMWEDDANRHGGKWSWSLPLQDVLRVDKDWERLVMAAVGGSLEDGSKAGDVVGVAYGKRKVGYKLSVWTKDKNNTASLKALAKKIREVLNLPPEVVLVYTAHDSNDGILKA